jgi:hypothetical protein
MMPVEKLSTPITWWPSDSRRSTNVDPMNPAAPVTNARMVRCLPVGGSRVSTPRGFGPRAVGNELCPSPPPAIEPNLRELDALPTDSAPSASFLSDTANLIAKVLRLAV